MKYCMIIYAYDAKHWVFIYYISVLKAQANTPKV